MLNDKYKLYGAALYHISQHAGYSSMTALDDRTYLVNGQTVVYFKHASKPNTMGEYQFTFTLEEIYKFDDWQHRYGQVLLSLICVEGEEICCLSHSQFEPIWEQRQTVAGDIEKFFWLKLVLPAGKGFRVYADYPGRRKVQLGEELIIPRTDFPNRIFAGVPAQLAS